MFALFLSCIFRICLLHIRKCYVSVLRICDLSIRLIFPGSPSSCDVDICVPLLRFFILGLYS